MTDLEPGRPDAATRRTRRAERVVTGALAATIVAALAFIVVYVVDAGPQAEGVALGLGLVALALALTVWARHLLPAGPDVEERAPVPTSAEEREEVGEALDREGLLERRAALRRLLAGAVGALGIAAVVPLRSLGPDPDDSLERTPFGPGRRLVNQSGRPVRADEVPVDGLVEVFPEGAVGSADGQAVLIQVGSGRLTPLPGREDWSPDGLIAYSRVCTHAGCPVGLYQTATHTLLCPCHQSTFAVLDGARPLDGPAARALPQLPLAVDADGFVVARGDFSGPVGPGFWNRSGS